MADIELVINITKHEWEYLNKLVESGDQLGHYERLLVNGTPLPKGHGRLIDKEALVTFPDNPTNGDIIKALFPNSEAIFMLRNVLKTDIIKIENEAFLVDENWWNAPYKKGDKEK